MDKTIIKITEAMKPLEDINGGGYSDSVTGYFKYYGLDFDSSAVEHIFGTFESGTMTLAGHIFKPKKYKAAVFVVHGYFGHCGQLNLIIKYLLDAGYAAATFDLPGHGLSGGERGGMTISHSIAGR